jgi:hypothetical protein
MFIQGDLQKVFDALYEVGAIDPILKADWAILNKQMLSQFEKANSAFAMVNSCRGNIPLLVEKLKDMDEASLQFVAMEVAREFAEFQDRKAIH